MALSAVPAPIRYGVAALAVLLVACARSALGSYLDDRETMLPFAIAVMIAAAVGGYGPGLFATALSALVIDWTWMTPSHSFWSARIEDQVALGVFILTGVAISASSGALGRARVRAERKARELRAGQSAYRRLLETASEGIWTLDSKGNVTFVNQSMAELLGGSMDALIGKPATEFVYDDDVAASMAQFETVLRGERGTFETRLRRTDGTPAWVLLSSAPVLDAEGRSVGVLGMFTDVTARHRAESELQRLLTRETEARSAAEAASQAKDDFLAIISHELRTPLNAMLGWLTMLRSGVLEEGKVGRALEVIERNARSQAKLIEDLLDVSRMISGKLRLDLQRVSITATLQSALDVVATTASDKGIVLSREIQCDDIAVAGDPERLRQVLVNLLTNAVKFTPSGGQVRLELSKVGRRIAIVIADDGQGIDPAFLPHVFDRFRQQDGSMTRKHAGLGLGLAIVRALVELHGGEVKAESDGPGKGSRFRVTLPTLESASAVPLPPETPALHDSTALDTGSFTLPGIRIVVVDDEIDSREMLRELLAKSGADVRTAGSASEALGLVLTFKPNLLVSDLAMPGEDGYDLLGRIRALHPDRGGATPAIALTAHARRTDRLRVLASGFAAYLAKPVEPTELIATARKVLRSSGVHSEVSSAQ